MAAFTCQEGSMADASHTITSLSDRMRSSVPMRIFTVGFLALLLQIPIGMIDGTIAERRARRDEAMADVTRSWGGRQLLRGPMLHVPYVRRWTDTVEGKDGKPKAVRHESFESLYVLPETLAIEGDLKTEIRRRGIFDVPLYVTHLTLRGSIRLPAPADFPSDTDEIEWNRMTLATGLTNPRAIRDEASLVWNGQAETLEPGVGSADFLDSGIHAVVASDAAGAPGSSVPFIFKLSLAGSDSLGLLPAGSDTEVHLTSKWPHPSFEGAYLPVTRTVGETGFEARWKVLRLSRAFPPVWRAGDLGVADVDPSVIGVRLVSPVDAYTTTERAVKYELLFIYLTFGAIFLVEVMARIRVHPVQYLLIGFALCLFYLLLLSLAEHTGFLTAYATASAAVTLLVTAYSRAVLGSRARTAAVATLVATLYGYLFVLLQIQDYALLVGSAGLFAALALVMYLTRGVDWYRLHSGGVAPVLAGESR
jgi:inner membrane protein